LQEYLQNTCRILDIASRLMYTCRCHDLGLVSTIRAPNRQRAVLAVCAGCPRCLPCTVNIAPARTRVSRNSPSLPMPPTRTAYLEIHHLYQCRPSAHPRISKFSHAFPTPKNSGFINVFPITQTGPAAIPRRINNLIKSEAGPKDPSCNTRDSDHGPLAAAAQPPYH
jgi:hypothetical protein